MCLYSKQSKPHSISWDILCYKLLWWDKSQNVYKTPITNTSVLSKEMIAEGKPDIEQCNINSNKCYGIREGYIHVYGSYYDAKTMLGYFPRLCYIYSHYSRKY